MDSFRVDHDPDVWVRVPTEFPDGDDADVETWAGRQAVRARERGFTETLDTGTLDQYFVDMVEAARPAGEHNTLWGLVADDAPGFLAIALDVEAPDSPLEEMLSALVAHRDNEYEPATYSQTEAAALGEGVCVHRLDLDSNRRAYQSLYYVFRAEGSDYIVSTETYDSVALTWAVPKIVEFIDGISPAQADAVADGVTRG